MANITENSVPQPQAKTLTVVVVNDKGETVQGAKVSISPSDSSGATNSVGEIQFKLGNSKKYAITATAGSKTVTVPYYVTADGATRLVVNPVYVKSVEAKLHKSTFSGTKIAVTSGIILLVAIVAFFVWKRTQNKKHKQ